MDEFIGELGSRLKVSITDSTMMTIVNNAMDKAHGKVKSDGVIARLNEISRFYELAVIQLEGCMKFVQEEADTVGLDTSHRDLLFDLAKVRDHLLGRLEEAETAICQKDREMIEIRENVLKLRHALEFRERELEALRRNQNPMVEKRSKSAGGAEMMNFVEMNSGKHNNKGDEFCERKNSVDQQVWNMRQKYESNQSNNNNNSIDNKRIERMGLDINNLKETFDLAFGKMQSAIFSSEAGPVEHQWRWSIERDVSAILVKGLIDNIEKTCKMGKRKNHNDESEEEKEDRVDDLVGRIINTHKSIVKQKMEELNRLRGQIVFWSNDSMNGRIEKVIFILDSIMKWNAKLNKELDAELYYQVEKLKEIKQGDTVLQGMVTNEMYLSLFRGLTDDFCFKTVVNGSEFPSVASLLKDDINMVFLKETVEKWNKSIDASDGARQIKWQLDEEETRLSSTFYSGGLAKLICADPMGGRSLRQFSTSLLNFQQSLHDCLVSSNLRLGDIKCKLDSLSEQINLLRKKESVYKKAFVRRCQNLRRAENEVLKEKNKHHEVDLLGDQVDLLLGLLETIYIKLDNYSPVLQKQDSEISEILMCIRKELGGQP